MSSIYIHIPDVFDYNLKRKIESAILTEIDRRHNELNEKLKPDIFGDVREFHKDLEFQYDIIIAADILEHIPFNDLQGTIKNFYQY